MCEVILTFPTFPKILLVWAWLRVTSERGEIEFNARLSTHRIMLVGHVVSETVKLCIAARHTNTRNDGISFFKIHSLVILRQRWARELATLEHSVQKRTSLKNILSSAS